MAVRDTVSLLEPGSFESRRGGHLECPVKGVEVTENNLKIVSAIARSSDRHFTHLTGENSGIIDVQEACMTDYYIMTIPFSPIFLEL